MVMILVLRWNMKVIIDRIENDLYVVEMVDGIVGKISKNVIPNAKEGDVVEINILKKDTNDRKVSIKKLMDDVFK